MHVAEAHDSSSTAPVAAPAPIEPLDTRSTALLDNARGVSLRGVTKIYGHHRGATGLPAKAAVDNVYMDMVEGQIFALLGHNVRRHNPVRFNIFHLYS